MCYSLDTLLGSIYCVFSVLCSTDGDNPVEGMIYRDIYG